MRARSDVLLAGAVLLTTILVVPAAPANHAAGTINGTVGTPPKMKPADMAKEPACVKAHPTPVITENVVTGPGNTIRWVVIYHTDAQDLA
jgi:hypothetical protein